MSDPQIVDSEVEDTCDDLNSADAAVQAFEERRKMYISRATADILLWVEELVDELHAFHRAQVDDIEWLHETLPLNLLFRIRKFLYRSGKRLVQLLPTRERQEARLRIMEAMGLCLENARCVKLIDTELLGRSTEMSSSEVEALYRRRLELSTALDKLVIRIPDPENGKEFLEPKIRRLVADNCLRPGLKELEVPLFLLADVVAARSHGPSPGQEVVTIAPTLKKLHIRIRTLADEAIAELMGETIAAHQSLLGLELEVDPETHNDSGVDEDETDDDPGEYESDSRETGVRAVSIGEKKMGCLGLLLSRAFLGYPCNTSIHTLSITYENCTGAHGMTADLEVLLHLLTTGIHITQFGFHHLEFVRSCDLRRFFRLILVHGTHLQSLHLSQLFSWGDCWGFDADSFAMLAELLQSKSVHALKDLTFYLDGGSGYINEFDWPSFYTSLSLSQIESVDIGPTVGYKQAERTILEWIQRSKSLQKLSFRVHKEDKINWKSIFRSLRENTNLESLKVDYEALDDDDAYRELMGVLQVNSTLEQVTTYEERGPRWATVREGLRCKARREGYLDELRQGLGRGPAEWRSPKCGRIFVCGSPEAGKTLLTSTMRKLAKQKSRGKKLVENLRVLTKSWRDQVLRRTEGMEIHTLRNDEQMQIFIWDLAGQYIFRALQQFLFPRLSRASVFIFVFSPFVESHGKLPVSGGKELKPRLQNAFEKELLEWLRFIASNSAVTGFNLPQLMVVITHQDIYKSLKMDLKWCDTVLTRLITAFADVIHIHHTPYFIDGHESQLVKPIVDDMYSIFQELFQGKLFKVPTACSDLSQQLVRWVSENQQEPIIDDQTFFSLCGMIPDLRPFSEKCDEEDSKRLLKAVVSYLHDVGTVIDMTIQQEVMEKVERSKSNLIVVNPNWLTQVFLGRFICFGQGFQLATREEVEWAKRSVDGFMCETDFQQLLRKCFLEPMKKQFPKLTFQTLQDLMENLDLLYVTKTVDQKGHSDPLFFIPTFFKMKSEQNLHWHQNAYSEKTGLAGEICFLGVRLCCRDLDRTYLSSAFFSRFQVMIWKKFSEEMQLNNPVIYCKFNLISIVVDGFDVFIENDEGGDFIDVLIRSNKSLKTVWNYAERCILREVFGFCASSKGCPGVELVMHIIRTECVKRLTPCKHRKSQSVSKEDLNRNLMISIKNLGPNSEEKDLYSHTWTPVPGANLEAEWEQAVELLSPDDVYEAYAFIKSKTRSLQDKVDMLKDVMEEVDSESEELNLAGLGVQNNKKLQQSDEKRSQKIHLNSEKGEKNCEKSPNSETDDNYIVREIRDLKCDVRRVGENVKEVLAEVRDVKLEIQKMNRFHQRAEENLTRMYHKLNQLMGQSMSTTVWPRRPYFSRKDVSLRHRITAMVDIGKPLVLHFQCEEIHGHHIVPDQPGYGITVRRDNCEALRQISKTSMRVIRYLLKAGLHVSVGAAELVPELEMSDGNVTSLTSSPIVRLLRIVQVQEGRTSSRPTDPCSPEEAWRYLQDYLANNLKSRITECFLLHPVEYFDSESTHAWLCQECLDTGLKENKLKKL